MLATGIVLGIGLRLAFETTADWQDKERLKERLFWQIKRPVSDRELKVVVGMFMVIFGLLSLAVI
jgi:hypothetical protein